MAKNEEIAVVDKVSLQLEINPSDTIVDSWFTETFNGLNGISTEAYNNVYKAKENLKQKLKGE